MTTHKILESRIKQKKKRKINFNKYQHYLPPQHISQSTRKSLKARSKRIARMDARTAITHVHSNLLVVWWLLYENSVSRNTRISLNTRSRRTQIHGYLNFWQWRKGSKRGSREREKIGGRGIGERRKGGGWALSFRWCKFEGSQKVWRV